MTHAELEKAYIALTHDVQKQARRIMAMAANGRAQDASIAALTLSDTAADARNAYEMQQEQTAPDRFSLAMLKIHAETGSNSETGWEREE